MEYSTILSIRINEKMTPLSMNVIPNLKVVDGQSFGLVFTNLLRPSCTLLPLLCSLTYWSAVIGE